MTGRAVFAACLALQAAGAAAQGGAYAERFAVTCTPCHGVQGASSTALTPTLAGLSSFYAITQLFLFRDGRRDNVLMTGIAKGMSDADLRGYSEAIAALPPAPPPEPGADPERTARGAALVQRLHCNVCHGADFSGGRQVPRLAGQREDYLLQALRGFRAATRVGYSPAMTEALAGVTPEQIEDLAQYLSQYRSQYRSQYQPSAGASANAQ